MSNHSNAETVVLVTLGFHSGSIKTRKLLHIDKKNLKSF